MKKCLKCGCTKDLDDFYVNNRFRDKHRNECKICSDKAQRYRDSKNPQRLKDRYKKYNSSHRERWVHYHLRKYNMTKDLYNVLLLAQNSSCAICGISQSALNKSLSVDHDHRCCKGKSSCGKCIRGLLCTTCNSLLGFTKDDAVILSKAIIYLNR